MKQNIYDNPDFFAGYSLLRQKKAGLNDVLEQPAMRSLLPDVTDAMVLDLGCGAGELCRELREKGASAVTGVDISSRMLAMAKSFAHDGTYVHSSIEDFQAQPGSFDLVVSSLALHYVRDFSQAVSSIAGWLADGGHLVFSIEHPLATAAQGILSGWRRDGEGKKLHWMLDCYQDEGERKSHWFVDGVIRYHRTVATMLNAVIEGGFALRRILEPHAPEWAEHQRPDLEHFRSRARNRRHPSPLLMYT